MKPDLQVMELQILAILLNCHQIPIQCQMPQFGFLVHGWGAMSQVNLVYQNVYQCTLKPGVVKAYIIELLIYNLDTLLSRFIKSFP